jgi:hypothetical protein
MPTASAATTAASAAHCIPVGRRRRRSPALEPGEAFAPEICVAMAGHRSRGGATFRDSSPSELTLRFLPSVPFVVMATPASFSES